MIRTETGTWVKILKVTIQEVKACNRVHVNRFNTLANCRVQFFLFPQNLKFLNTFFVFLIISIRFDLIRSSDSIITIKLVMWWLPSATNTFFRLQLQTSTISTSSRRLQLLRLIPSTHLQLVPWNKWNPTSVLVHLYLIIFLLIWGLISFASNVVNYLSMKIMSKKSFLSVGIYSVRDLMYLRFSSCDLRGFTEFFPLFPLSSLLNFCFRSNLKVKFYFLYLGWSIIFIRVEYFSKIVGLGPLIDKVSWCKYYPLLVQKLFYLQASTPLQIFMSVCDELYKSTVNDTCSQVES